MKTILIVDDQPRPLMEIADALAAAGHRVIAVPDGDFAKAVIIAKGFERDAGPADLAGVDLVCTDERIPGTIDGIALAQWIKKLSPKLPVVITSSAAGVSGVVVDAAVYLMKPLNHGELVNRIEGLLKDHEVGVCV